MHDSLSSSIAPSQKTISFERRAFLTRASSYASVGVALSIIIIKLIAWTLTDSLSLLSSLVDSALDVSVSLLNLFAIGYALMPPDEDHRFGHGKAEDIAALLQGAFIAGSGLFITVEALQRIFNPRPIESGEIGIIVMLISTALTIGLVLFQRFVVRQTGSTLVKADSLHYTTDIAANIVVIVSFVVLMFTDWYWVDSFLALVIAAYILNGARLVAKGAFDRLMDKEFTDEERQKIKDLILSHPDVKGMHDLRTRHVGFRPFIQFHLELDGHITLDEAHRIADEVEDAIMQAYPNAGVITHQDPFEDGNKHTARHEHL
ncbi:MAG: Cation efflux protein [Rickettsiales bacterium]|jgi:ferrous-iron efflux pump FieF|nr:Cation efflux protein [Rickettsiales bacterium]